MTKIVNIEQLLFNIRALKKLQKRIVLVTGCFDILHSAHKEFLKRAKREGDILLVGLESDERVKRLKGEKRPVNSWRKRAKALAILPEVDFVSLLPKNLEKREVQERLISQIKPDILAISAHTPNINKKKAVMEKFGGKIKIVLGYDSNISTTKILLKS